MKDGDPWLEALLLRPALVKGRQSIDLGRMARSSAGAIFQADGITSPLTYYGGHGRPFLAFRRRAYFLDSQASGRIAGAILILLLLDALSFGLPFNEQYNRLPPSRQWPYSRDLREDAEHSGWFY